MEKVKAKDYDKFSNKLDEIKKTGKCPKCGSDEIISVHFKEYIIMCTRCGEQITINTNNNEIK